jgi:hypothetical protein
MSLSDSNITVEVTNPETPFGGVQVFGNIAQDISLVTVEVTFPETPFGGVQVFGSSDQPPVQIEINTGSPVLSVFGRIGNIVPLCTDYDQCYAPLHGDTPVVGAVSSVFGRTGDILALQGDYDAFYEPDLGNPSTNGWILSSTAAGARSWIAPPSGGGGTPVFVFGQSPTGSINGTNKVFASSSTFMANSLEVYLNGLRQRRVDDYTELSGTTFQFLLAPLPGDSISIDYVVSSSGPAHVYGETPSGAINGVNKNFTTVSNYSPTFLAVFKSGLRLRRTDDYTETGANSFQLVDAPLSGDNLSVDYIQP